MHEQLVKAIDELLAFADTNFPSAEQVQQWNDEGEKEAGDARYMYLGSFVELDGAVAGLAELTKLSPMPPAATTFLDSPFQRREKHGFTALVIENDGYPLAAEWELRLKAFRAAVVAQLGVLRQHEHEIAAPDLPRQDTTAIALSKLSDDERLSSGDLAQRLGLNPDKLRKRLQRWRADNDSGWVEIANRPARQAQFFYQVGPIRQLLRDALESERKTSVHEPSGDSRMAK